MSAPAAAAPANEPRRRRAKSSSRRVVVESSSSRAASSRAKSSQVVESSRVVAPSQVKSSHRVKSSSSQAAVEPGRVDKASPSQDPVFPYSTPRWAVHLVAQKVRIDAFACLNDYWEISSLTQQLTPYRARFIFYDLWVLGRWIQGMFLRLFPVVHFKIFCTMPFSPTVPFTLSYHSLAYSYRVPFLGKAKVPMKSYKCILMRQAE